MWRHRQTDEKHRRPRKTEMESTELTKDLSVSRPHRQIPEIAEISVDSNLQEADIVVEILEQNETVQGTCLELRTSFTGKRGRTIMLAVDKRTYERLAETRKENVDWCQADFWPNPYR